MKALSLSGAIALQVLGFGVPKVMAETPMPVMDICPQATWTQGYNLWELISLDASQHRIATVIDGPVNVRTGIGFDAPVAFTLNTGVRVRVEGESWDTGCNQWMYVRVEGSLYWIHGNFLTW